MEKKSGIIEIITSPLGFFALSLLIVEAFLSTVLTLSNLSPESKYWGMIIGAALFVLVVVGVFLLVWFKPKNLTYGENSHLHEEEMKNHWGVSEFPESKSEIEDETLVAPTEKI